MDLLRNTKFISCNRRTRLIRDFSKDPGISTLNGDITCRGYQAVNLLFTFFVWSSTLRVCSQYIFLHPQSAFKQRCLSMLTSLYTDRVGFWFLPLQAFSWGGKRSNYLSSHSVLCVCRGLLVVPSALKFQQPASSSASKMKYYNGSTTALRN